MTPLEWLFSLEQFGIKFGLDNITALLDAFGRPERTFASVHVAGTNGKGSVTAMTDAILRAAGHRSARYTSPHLVDVTERFVVDGSAVAQAELESAVADLRLVVERLLAARRLSAPPTFFEATTACAFELFRRAAVGVAVCEVGLGGRLDATNVLEPRATAITSIGLDHQQHLGDTIAAIAFEKAGIIKPDTPVIVGAVPADARSTIADVARERGAPLIDAPHGVSLDEGQGEPGEIVVSTPVGCYGPFRPALRGRHQVGNAVVAIRLVEALAARGLVIPPSAVTAGLTTVRWPGRLEVRRLPDGREALLDAAHNVDGAQVLAEYLRESGWAGRPLVFAAMRDKNAEAMLRVLGPASGAIVVTSASNPRSADPAALAGAARAAVPDRTVLVRPSPAAALDAAWDLSPQIVVAGSIFLLGDAIGALDGT